MEITQITVLEDVELNNPVFIEAFRYWSCR